MDLRALPGWTLQERRFAGHQLRTALNPHSALLVLSRAKLTYALRHIDLAFRGPVVGGPMASAYAHFHKPFTLWRCSDDLRYHSVVHLDDWLGGQSQPDRAAFTAVLASGNGRQDLPAVVASLERIPYIREILLWNNGGARLPALPGVTVFDAPRDFRSLPRFCLGPLARHENLWFQDADLLLEPAQFEQLVGEYRQDRGHIYGCRGRNLRDGSYIPEDAYGDVDVVLGQSMMFHRSLLPRAFAALGELPPDEVEDDISFSLAVPRKHRAIDIGTPQGKSEDPELMPEQVARRQAAVERALAQAAKVSPEAERIAALEMAQSSALTQLRSAEAELGRLRIAEASLRACHDQLRTSLAVRAFEQLKSAPLLYGGYLLLKRLSR